MSQERALTKSTSKRDFERVLPDCKYLRISTDPSITKIQNKDYREKKRLQRLKVNRHENVSLNINKPSSAKANNLKSL